MQTNNKTDALGYKLKVNNLSIERQLDQLDLTAEPTL